MSYVVPVKSKVKISQNFVAFSEYMNFKKGRRPRFKNVDYFVHSARYGNMYWLWSIKSGDTKLERFRILYARTWNSITGIAIHTARRCRWKNDFSFSRPSNLLSQYFMQKSCIRNPKVFFGQATISFAQYQKWRRF